MGVYYLAIEDSVMSKSRNLEDLSTPGAIRTFLLWNSGVAVKSVMRHSPQERSYWRHKADILEVLGVDISKTLLEQTAARSEVKFNGEYLIKRDRAPSEAVLQRPLALA